MRHRVVMKLDDGALRVWRMLPRGYRSQWVSQLMRQALMDVEWALLSDGPEAERILRDNPLVKGVSDE